MRFPTAIRSLRRDVRECRPNFPVQGSRQRVKSGRIGGELYGDCDGKSAVPARLTGVGRLFPARGRKGCGWTESAVENSRHMVTSCGRIRIAQSHRRWASGFQTKKRVALATLFRGTTSFCRCFRFFRYLLEKSCKCLMFKLGIWKFHFSFIYSNQSGTVKLFYLCFTPHPAEIP